MILSLEMKETDCTKETYLFSLMEIVSASPEKILFSLCFITMGPNYRFCNNEPSLHSQN